MNEIGGHYKREEVNQMALTDDQVKEAIGQMKSYTRQSVEAHKAGITEYEFLSARGVLHTLGYPEDETDQVLQVIADRGFDYCLDPHIGHRDRSTKEVTYPSADACHWGADQLLSRLRFIS